MYINAFRSLNMQIQKNNALSILITRDLTHHTTFIQILQSSHSHLVLEFDEEHVLVAHSTSQHLHAFHTSTETDKLPPLQPTVTAHPNLI